MNRVYKLYSRIEAITELKAQVYFQIEKRLENLHSNVIKQYYHDGEKLIDKVLKTLIEHFYDDLSKLKEYFGYDEHRLINVRNYEIEIKLNEIQSQYLMLINEPCPINGNHCSYNTIREKNIHDGDMVREE
jgi:hypothetical protein